MIDPRPCSFPRALARRTLAVLTGAAALALAATPAWSQAAHPHDEETCQATLKDAKAREQDGALQAAKALLRSCAQNPCSKFVRQQCANRYNKLDMDTPTVVLVVSDAVGTAPTCRCAWTASRSRRRSTEARCPSTPACMTSRSSSTGT
jgi:hypothetical protein